MVFCLMIFHRLMGRLRHWLMRHIGTLSKVADTTIRTLKKASLFCLSRAKQQLAQILPASRLSLLHKSTCAAEFVVRAWCYVITDLPTVTHSAWESRNCLISHSSHALLTQLPHFSQKIIYFAPFSHLSSFSGIVFPKCDFIVAIQHLFLFVMRCDFSLI